MSLGPSALCMYIPSEAGLWGSVGWGSSKDGVMKALPGSQVLARYPLSIR